MTSFSDVKGHFPIHFNTFDVIQTNDQIAKQSADVSTYVTSQLMFYIFQKVLRLYYYHTKPQSSYCIYVDFRQGGHNDELFLLCTQSFMHITIIMSYTIISPPPIGNRLDQSPQEIELKNDNISEPLVLKLCNGRIHSNANLTSRLLCISE